MKQACVKPHCTGGLAFAAGRTPRYPDGIMRVDAPMKEKTMAWTTPTLVEICIGLEINGYLPAEF